MQLRHTSIQTEQQIRPQNGNWIWCRHAIILLGCWLSINAFTSGSTWGPDRINDIVCGAIMSIVALFGKRGTAATMCRWFLAVLAAWLLFAPLVLWTRNPAIYQSDTLSAALLVVFSFIVPGIPGLGEDESAPHTPPGWSYNPSSWGQRIPIIWLAIFGFFTARYMAAFQLGHIDSVWDPFFGRGTQQVLNSDVSRAFPISDAGLGALSYIVDALAGAIGGARRWRTAPWTVLLFGILIIPPGLTSLVLIMLQPISVGAWCTLCIAAAVAMTIMVPLTVDEVVATCQFLARKKRAGASLWKTILFGGSDIIERQAETPLPSTPLSFGSIPPLTLVASAAIGVWLMASPALVNTAVRGAQVSDWIVGSLVFTVAVLSLGPSCRMVRWLNVPFGVWLCISPFVFALKGAALGSEIFCGLLLIVLSVPRGKVKEDFGTWNRFIY